MPLHHAQCDCLPFTSGGHAETPAAGAADSTPGKHDDQALRQAQHAALIVARTRYPRENAIAARLKPPSRIHPGRRVQRGKEANEEVCGRNWQRQRRQGEHEPLRISTTAPCRPNRAVACLDWGSGRPPTEATEGVRHCGNGCTGVYAWHLKELPMLRRYCYPGVLTGSVPEHGVQPKPETPLLARHPKVQSVITSKSLRKTREALEILPRELLWPCSRVAALQEGCNGRGPKPAGAGQRRAQSLGR